MFSFVQLS